MLIPIPVHDKTEEVPQQQQDYEWIRWFINVPNWKCVKCSAVMFGRMTYCVYCKMKLGVDTPRPE